MSKIIKVEVVDVSKKYGVAKNGNSYAFLEVTCKQDGKAKVQKIMPFGNSKEIFEVLSSAVKGEWYDVDIEKQGDYWQWVKVVKGSMEQQPVESVAEGHSGTRPVARSNFETPEERARRQILIVRQSSLSNAIEFLKHNKKAFTIEDLFQTAENLVGFVNGVVPTEPASMDNLEDDIPY